MSEIEKPARSCGECTACCKTHWIESLKKPSGKWCGNCTPGKGCTIYATRPGECVEYTCAWLDGVGTEDQRPDKVGVVIDCMWTHGMEEKFFRVWEVFEGALRQPFATAQIDALIKAGQAVRVSPLGHNPHFLIAPFAKVGPQLRKLLRLDSMD